MELKNLQIAEAQVVQQLQDQVEQVLNRDYRDWNFSALRMAGSGLENVVFRAESDRYGTLAVRVPWVRWISNANDPALDARDLLQKEMVLANHLHRHGLPTPRTFFLHEEEQLVFTVAEFVENDGSEVDRESMGKLLAQVHEVPLPEGDLLRRPRRLQQELSQRIAERTKTLEKFTGLALPLPDERTLAEQLTWSGEKTGILHMDVRSANILSYQGEIRALVDWSNALIGDPGLDLARTMELGFGDDAFLRGYGEEKGLGRLPRVVELLYRLDTATMLANVFLSESPDRNLAEQQVRGVLELHHLLKKEW